MEAEEEYKFDLKFCKMQIKGWIRWYMRKNSKYPAKILLRCNHTPREIIFWKYYLELWVNGKLIDQSRIIPEAYDTFDYDKSLRKEQFTGLEFITYKEFIPVAKINVTESINQTEIASECLHDRYCDQQTINQECKSKSECNFKS